MKGVWISTAMKHYSPTGCDGPDKWLGGWGGGDDGRMGGDGGGRKWESKCIVAKVDTVCTPFNMDTINIDYLSPNRSDLH